MTQSGSRPADGENRLGVRGLQRRAEVGADGLEAEPREVACEAPVVVELFG